MIILLATSSALFANHKIIIQISPPRCLSTAALRMWQARGDFEVMNEAFISAFVSHSSPDQSLTSNWWREGVPHTFEETIEKVFHLAETRPVFIKEESFSLVEYLRTNRLLITNPNVHFIFLVRNPHHAISSLYKKHGKTIHDFSYMVGFQPCYEIFQMVQEHGINQPVILQAEDLYTRPYETAQSLCAALDIPFIEQMLEWQDLGDSFTGTTEWHELKNPELTHYWHGDAITSTGFHTPATYDVDNQGNPTFSEVLDENDRAECIEAYHANKLYYDLLLAQQTVNFG